MRHSRIVLLVLFLQGLPRLLVFCAPCSLLCSEHSVVGLARACTDEQGLLFYMFPCTTRDPLFWRLMLYVWCNTKTIRVAGRVVLVVRVLSGVQNVEGEDHAQRITTEIRQRAAV